MGCLSAKSDNTQDNLSFPNPNVGDKVQDTTENKASMVGSVANNEIRDSAEIKQSNNVVDTKVYLHINVLGS